MNMANMTKKTGDQPQGNQPQGNQPQGNQPAGGQQLASQQRGEGQRGELVRAADPMQMMLRDPLRLMREFINNPFGMLMSPLRSSGINQMIWNPNFEVRETDDAFVFKGDLPGVRNEDLDITVTGNRIEISGKREIENENTEGMLHTYERSYGDFRRTFSLPESADVDKVRVDLKDGVLTMVVPKKQGTAQQSRKIQIGSGSRS
jgi:HSP20 family protein